MNVLALKLAPGSPTPEHSHHSKFKSPEQRVRLGALLGYPRKKEHWSIKNLDNWPNRPRGHKDLAVIARKLALIDAPHVKTLNAWVRAVNRARGGDDAEESLVPWFDPSGGGSLARVLFLLEAPGSNSSRTRGSGFISIDNGGGTAANLFDLVAEAGLPRTSFAMANIVPWYLPDGTRTRATKKQDVLDAREYIDSMLESFEQLELVITMGDHAARGWQELRSASERARTLDWKTAPHPGAQNLITRPYYREDLRKVLIAAAKAVDEKMTDGEVERSALQYSVVGDRVAVELDPCDLLLLVNCLNDALGRLGIGASRIENLHRGLERILSEMPPEGGETEPSHI